MTSTPSQPPGAQCTVAPRRAARARLRRLHEAGWPIRQATDHGTHEAIYLHDPDLNGIELAWDRPRAAWPERDGALVFMRRPLDFADLLGELDAPEAARHLPALAQYT